MTTDEQVCRHHHRIKQLGWTKTRQRDGSLVWTHPDGLLWELDGHPDDPAAFELRAPDVERREDLAPGRRLPPARLVGGKVAGGLIMKAVDLQGTIAVITGAAPCAAAGR